MLFSRNVFSRTSWCSMGGGQKTTAPRILGYIIINMFFLSFLFEFSYLHIKTEACYVVYICAVYVFIFLLVSGTSRPHYAKSLMN